MFDNFIAENHIGETYRTVKLLLLKAIITEGTVPQYVHFHVWIILHDPYFGGLLDVVNSESVTEVWL